jgi:protein-S-isoprenylcysteine O-methyltransferase Ste14
MRGKESKMAGVLSLLYGAIAYLIFLGTFLYAIAFVGNLPVPKSIDSGEAGSVATALIVNAACLALFAIQHSVMARPQFKAWWTRLVPQAIERSTYVLLASLALLLLYWQWRPLPQSVWLVSEPLPAALLAATFWIGWGSVLLSTFLINHFELFGLQQVYARLRRRALSPPVFKTPLLYKMVRHPIYLGFLLAFWATPSMSVGHLMFSLATTAYILIGIYLEERDLIALFGEQYRRYRQEVGMLVPLPGRKLGAELAPPSELRRR